MVNPWSIKSLKRSAMHNQICSFCRTLAPHLANTLFVESWICSRWVPECTVARRWVAIDVSDLFMLWKCTQWLPWRSVAKACSDACACGCDALRKTLPNFASCYGNSLISLSVSKKIAGLRCSKWEPFCDTEKRAHLATLAWNDPKEAFYNQPK